MFIVQRWFTLSIEPPSQVVSFTELCKQAQVTAGRWGKAANPCGPLTIDIYSQFSVIPILLCN